MTTIITNASELTQLRAFRLLHRLCKEVNVVRSKRSRVMVVISHEVTKPVISADMDVTSRGMIYINKWWKGSQGFYPIVISVGFQWLRENLTKKEFVQYTKLRLKF